MTSEPFGIDCGLVCESNFAAGGKVKLTETPEPGSTFDGWSRGCYGTASTCEVTMSAAQSVSATFDLVVARQDKLTIAKAGWLGQGRMPGGGRGLRSLRGRIPRRQQTDPERRGRSGLLVRRLLG